MTGSGKVTTDLATMQAASQHVFEVSQNIQSQLASLLGRLDPLASQWQGTSAASFQALKVQWHEAATKLNAALGDIGQALVASTQNYGSSDDESRQGFTSISSVLG